MDYEKVDWENTEDVERWLVEIGSDTEDLSAPTVVQLEALYAKFYDLLADSSAESES